MSLCSIDTHRLRVLLGFIVFVSLSHSSVHVSSGLRGWPLSTEEIQELLLTQLLPSVCKQQLIQHLQLQNDKQLLQDKLLLSEVMRGSAVFYNHINKIPSAFLLSSYKISECGMNAKSGFVSGVPPRLQWNACSGLLVLIWLVAFKVRNYWPMTFCLYGSSQKLDLRNVCVCILCSRCGFM